MSGGGGRDWSEVGRPATPSAGGDGAGGGQPDPCDIVSVTNLNSPNAAVIRTLRPGDVLQVAYQAGPTPPPPGSDVGRRRRREHHVGRDAQDHRLHQQGIRLRRGGDLGARRPVPGPGAAVTVLLVVGGIYRERCIWPEWRRTFGSAGRAAVAIAPFYDRTDVPFASAS